jgi:hypothetical protein
MHKITHRKTVSYEARNVDPVAFYENDKYAARKQEKTESVA